MITDYYSFGALMPGRIFSSSNYRYGFNGKENDNEVKGVTGSQQDYGLRIYDPRLGKFLSVDPLTASYPWYTPYQFSGNSPIAFTDIDGGEEKVSNMVTTITKTVPEIIQPSKELTKELAQKALETALENNGGTITKTAAVETVTGAGAGSTILSNVLGTLFYILLPANSDYKGPGAGGGPEIPMPTYKPITTPAPATITEPVTAPVTVTDPLPAYMPSPKVAPSPVPLLRPVKVDTDDDDDKGLYIYRGGLPSNSNLTPRPGKDTEGEKRGLSTFTSAEKAKAVSGKPVATKISVIALRAQGLTVDFIGDHASIRPATQEELDSWAATKDAVIKGAPPSSNTVKVQNAVKGVE